MKKHGISASSKVGKLSTASLSVLNFWQHMDAGEAGFAAGLWAIASAVLGVALAVFNVWILFPREVES
jgi:hypothetical protein